jgi:DNA-directed RNA polymerases I, II, and III subunit RPABC1
MEPVYGHARRVHQEPVLKRRIFCFISTYTAVMNLSEEVYKSFSTVREMLADRGLDVTSLLAHDFEALKKLSTVKSIFTIDDASSGVRIIYNLNSKLKFSDVRKLLDDDDSKAAGTLILITKDKMNTTNAKQINELNPSTESFEIGELMFNISRHVLVPKHEALRDEDTITQILNMYGLKSRHQLPLITRTDPMARYLGLRPGHLVRITRYSPAGEYVLYRCCV